jgi:hypothetical protein
VPGLALLGDEMGDELVDAAGSLCHCEEAIAVEIAVAVDEVGVVEPGRNAQQRLGLATRLHAPRRSC